MKQYKLEVWTRVNGEDHCDEQYFDTFDAGARAIQSAIKAHIPGPGEGIWLCPMEESRWCGPHPGMAIVDIDPDIYGEGNVWIDGRPELYTLEEFEEEFCYDPDEE